MRLLRSSLEGCGDHHSNALVPTNPTQRAARLGAKEGYVVKQGSGKESPTKKCRIGD